MTTLFSYLPEEDAVALCKLAEEQARKKHPLGPAVAGALGLGLGTLAGGAAGYGANLLHKRVTGKTLPVPHLMLAAPIIGGALGLAYNLAQAHQLEAMRDAAEGSHNKP